MGKHYYGTHSDKDEAMKIADTAARKDTTANCYTPSTAPGSCTFQEATALWTCKATAHYYPDSCDIHTVSIYRETDSENSEIPLQVPIDHTSIEVFSALTETSPDGSSPTQKESYTHADSHDYFFGKT